MTPSARLLMSAAMLPLLASPIAAQAPASPVSPALPVPAVPGAGGSGGWQEATAGSGLEDYLRALQVAGLAPVAMTAIRAWSPWELATHTPADSVMHPWRARLAHADAPGRRPRLAVIGPSTRSTYNTSFPFGLNDGAVWAGRGLTQSVSGGIQATIGPLMVQLAPVAFWSQNADVALAPAPFGGDAAFGDPYPDIDRPQRFGDGSYARVDGGQSTIRLDLFGLTAGVSTANEVWGPGVTHPLVMSANAAGIPRVFAGTARPIDLWIGRIHGRLMMGRLESSPYAPPNRDSVDLHRRLGLGAVGSFSPRFLPNLEIGVARFYQEQWPVGGPSLSRIRRLFESPLKARVGGNAYDDLPAQNQVASAFVRWALPPALEVYGEAYREDHSVDLRDLAVEPEHDLGYLLGMRRVWLGAEGRRLTALRVEIVNGRAGGIDAVRPQTHLYSHGALRSGHTIHGQAIGSEALYGGGGGILAVDHFTESGRLTVSFQRVGQRWKDGPAPGVPAVRGQDVVNALGAEVTRFRGPFEWHAGAQLLLEVNRNFQGEVGGAQFTAGARWLPTLGR